METNVFEVLNPINCNEHVERKGKQNLSYLSWAWAWAILKKHFPNATYRIYENSDGWCYFTDGRTCWVKTGVTVNGIEYIEYLPVMDYNNASIPANKVTSFDINKTIQRSLTKAIARHGLGLYIYAGEDLPDAADDERREKVNAEIDSTYQPMDDNRYSQYVASEAEGRNYKGKSYRDLWISATHAGPSEIKDFDEAVLRFKINNNL